MTFFEPSAPSLVVSVVSDAGFDAIPPSLPRSPPG